jgi:hypothetical protein
MPRSAVVQHVLEQSRHSHAHARPGRLTALKIAATATPSLKQVSITIFPFALSAVAQLHVAFRGEGSVTSHGENEWYPQSSEITGECARRLPKAPRYALERQLCGREITSTDVADGSKAANRGRPLSAQMRRSKASLERLQSLR